MINLPHSETSQEWFPLPSQLNNPRGGTSLARRQARSWGLVLEARRIPFRLERRVLGWQLLVPLNQLEEALKELRHYETENQNWPPPPPPPTELIDNRFSTLCVLIALGVFHNITLQQINLFGHYPVDWLGLGRLQVGKVMIGEWWRIVTALTLHADALHLLSNLVIGGVFISRLCRVLGAGLGWSLLLASGIGGNLINCWLQAPDHRAVGASTAVFGAVGLLGAISLVRYRHNLKAQKRWLLPLAGAVGLLAMFGAGGDNTDLGAHLWGFLCGLLLGGGVEFWLELHGRPSRLQNEILACAPFFVILFSWATALR